MPRLSKEISRNKQRSNLCRQAGSLSIENARGVVCQVCSILKSLLLGSSRTLLGHLALQTVVDSVENSVDSDARLERRLGALLVDTSLDEDGVPVVASLLVDGVGATDVTLGSVTDEVDG